MVTRAGIVRIKQAFPLLGSKRGEECYFTAYYRILKRGRKPVRWMDIRAHDELEAYMKACEALRRMGHKI